MQHTASFQCVHGCRIWPCLMVNLPKSQNWSYVTTCRPGQTVIALQDIAGVEQQECTDPKRTFGFSLVEVFVAHERALLIIDQAADLNPLGNPCSTSPYT